LANRLAEHDVEQHWQLDLATVKESLAAMPKRADQVLPLILCARCPCGKHDFIPQAWQWK
jgi:hypothetical protein